MAKRAFSKLLKVQEVDRPFFYGKKELDEGTLNQHKTSVSIMNSSSVLHQQSQNKIRSEFRRMKNDYNIKQAEPKLSKVMSSLHLSNKAGENKDPAESGRKPPLQPSGSRLPVLAKSLKLQASSEFKHCHKWEEKPLAGKAKKKKPCTRPIPFNFSQTKSTKRAVENREPLTVPQSRIHANQSDHSACKARPNKHRDVLKNSRDSLKDLGKSDGISGQPSPKLKTSAPLNNLLSTSGNTVTRNVSMSAAWAHLRPEVSSNLLAGKEPSKTSLADQTALLTTQTSRLKLLNGENFQTDHVALLSILRNEVMGHASQLTPKHSKPYNYLPQRVSIMKSQQKDGPTAGPMRFSPDAAALQSILQNEGVKAAGTMGATPRNSVCPSGRGTSIYTAQRVPVKKRCAESTCRPVAALKETAQTKWTPQRIRDTKHQPMSAMKWHQSSYGTLGHRSCKSNIQPRQEEVVQRLFDDPEDEQSAAGTDKDPSKQTEQIPVPAFTNKPPSEEKAEAERCNSDDDDDEEGDLQSFRQAPPRESVIFFSTGKKLIRAPRFENLEGSELQDQNDPVSSDQRKFKTAHSDPSELTHQINSAVHHLHKYVTTQKACSLNPAVAMIRKRFPPLEELRMDEEVATYTSVSVPAASWSVPSRSCCGNPVASILHFEESTRFVPIDHDLSSGPSSMFSSLQQQR
ncbi:uncharacterized protein LOC124873809 isoform X2 [Girardinichthys multiradiatus]|uniref:uncharacterized protein LOC124873809 isoform X2 n=1 Tax=Girardinichthys multiradiatus TaxID=208333 RepID=UPI001FACA584|nr:uncharacterized protein LOC124873809 isoform X2 [Girardinichthys multiradiatus]